MKAGSADAPFWRVFFDKFPVIATFIGWQT